MYTFSKNGQKIILILYEKKKKIEKYAFPVNCLPILDKQHTHNNNIL